MVALLDEFVKVDIHLLSCAVLFGWFEWRGLNPELSCVSGDNFKLENQCL